MATMVTIDGAAVDMDDPCALYQALYAVKLKLLAGERVEEIEIRSPVNQRRMRVAAGSIKALDDELMRLAAACELKNSGRRLRYAKRMRFAR